MFTRLSCVSATVLETGNKKSRCHTSKMRASIYFFLVWLPWLAVVHIDHSISILLNCGSNKDAIITCQFRGSGVYMFPKVRGQVERITFNTFTKSSVFCLDNVPNLKTLVIRSMLFKPANPCGLVQCCLTCPLHDSRSIDIDVNIISPKSKGVCQIIVSS